jgi:hypothetical protein
MSKKRMLADVLWEAANINLLPDGHDDGNQQHQWYSCCAIECAANPEKRVSFALLPPRVDEWLRSLGCPTKSSTAFLDYKDPEKRQGVRYMWLLLAMHVAEDEGITL